jgi:hypothetical protein
MTNIDKRWEGLTIGGELAVGVYYAGLRHKTFTMRIPLAGDLIDVQSEHPEASLHVATMAIYHRQLLSLGDIPAEALTFDLLRAELAETDLALLGAADEALEKKLALPSAASTAGDKSNTPLSGSATDSTK